MKIFIDIGHPAHVHYFRNFIRIMKKKGHEFFITARDKEVSLALLDKYDIPYFNRGKGSNSLIGKATYLLKADYLILRKSLKFNPDLFLSFASPYAAHVSKILKKPHISFTDTENAKLGILSFAPFTDCIITPKSFLKDFHEKHIRFDGFMELCYLHPKIFSPDKSVLRELNLTNDEKFTIVRFVSWGANHDIGQSGIPNKSKIELVHELAKKAKVFISSESAIPVGLEKYILRISPEKIHHILSFATLYIGEGATMASECAALGVPAIYVNSLTSGTLEEQEKYCLLFKFIKYENVLQKSIDLLDLSDRKGEFKLRQQRLLDNQIDVTAFMVWFIENYPDSFSTMKKSPEFQYRFR